MTSWDKDRLDLEVFGLDSSLYHKWWNASGGWSGYETLGGTFIYYPTALSFPSNNLHLFGVGSDSATWHKYYDGKWNPTGTGWTSLGGVCLTPPVVVDYGDERIAAFVIGTDRSCYVSTGKGGSFSAWENLKGTFVGDSLTAVSWSKDRLDVFGIGSDSALWHNWFNGKWNTWESLGGVCFGKPKAIAARNGRLDIFVKGTDSALYQKCYNGKWNDWQRLGGGHIYDPDAVSWDENRIDVFSVSYDTQLTHVYADISKNEVGNFRGNWEKLGGTCTSSPKALSRTVNSLDVFVKGTKQQVLQKYWDGKVWGPTPGVQLYDLGGSIISQVT